MSVFPFLNKSPAELNAMAASTSDANVVRARLEWLIKVKNASHEEFAFDLVHGEPAESTFHVTLAAIQATEQQGASRKRAAAADVFLHIWMELEEHACMRKLIMHRAKLPALCKKHGIHLRRDKDGFVFKFSHQEALTKCTELDLCKQLAVHSLMRVHAVHYGVEVTPAARAMVAQLLDAEAHKRMAK